MLWTCRLSIHASNLILLVKVAGVKSCHILENSSVNNIVSTFTVDAFLFDGNSSNVQHWNIAYIIQQPS